jgi:hypothetical protein
LLSKKTELSSSVAEGQRALGGVGGDELPRALEVVGRHQYLARAAAAHRVAGACTDVRLAVIAGNSFRPQEAADRLCFHRVSDNHESHSVHQAGYLAECKHVRLGAGLEESDLECPVVDRVVLAHELVEAAVSEHAVSVLVDVDAARGAWSLAVQEHAKANLLGGWWDKDEMGVTHVKPVGDAATGAVELDVLARDRPFTSQGPVVDGQLLGKPVGA